MARFDEASNIRWARMPWKDVQACRSSTASSALKTHCKLALIVRRD